MDFFSIIYCIFLLGLNLTNIVLIMSGNEVYSELAITVEELTDKTIKWLKEKKNLSINNSVNDLILSQCQTIFGLVHGDFVKMRSNGHCLILLGAKGTGKTTLCQDSQEYFNEHLYKNSLVVSYNNYENDNENNSLTPSQLIFNAIKTKFSIIFQNNKLSIDIVENILEQNNSYCFLVLDQFCNVFKDMVSNGKEIISEARKIGGSRKGRIHCILVGNNIHTRQLCFGKFKFPHLGYSNYTGVSLDWTKYYPIWLYPFLEKESFEDLTKHFGLQPDFNLYIETGGFPDK